MYKLESIHTGAQSTMEHLSLEILHMITDECAEQGIQAIAALRATSKVYHQRATVNMFRRQNINGHENSASSHIPSKFLRFFVSNPQLCCFTTFLEFHGGEFDVEKVEAIIRVLPNVTKFTLDHCSVTPSPATPIIDPLPQIRRAIFLGCCVDSGGLDDLFVIFERLEVIHFSTCSFEGAFLPISFPKCTSELLLDLGGGDLGEENELIEAWAQDTPSVRFLEFRCHTNGSVGGVMPWIMACAPSLERLKIATRGCILHFIFDVPPLNEVSGCSDIRGGFWRTPVTLTECHKLLALEIDCAEKNIVVLVDTLASLRDVNLERLRIGIHLVDHPTSPSHVTRLALGRLDGLLHDFFLRSILQRIKFDFHFYGVREPVEQRIYTGYAIKHTQLLPKIGSIPPWRREAMTYFHIESLNVYLQAILRFWLLAAAMFTEVLGRKIIHMRITVELKRYLGFVKEVTEKITLKGFGTVGGTTPVDFGIFWTMMTIMPQLPGLPESLHNYRAEEKTRTTRFGGTCILVQEASGFVGLLEKKPACLGARGQTSPSCNEGGRRERSRHLPIDVSLKRMDSRRYLGPFKQYCTLYKFATSFVPDKPDTLNSESPQVRKLVYPLFYDNPDDLVTSPKPDRGKELLVSSKIGDTRRSCTRRSPQSSAQGNEREQLEEKAVLQQHEQIYRYLMKVLPHRATDVLNKGIPTQKPGIPKRYRTEILAGTVPHGEHEEGAYENLSHFDYDGESNEASLRPLSSATLDTNEQNPSSSNKWSDVAATIATSTSSGTAANTVALVVVLWHLLPRMCPPLRPSEWINLLEDAIKEVVDMYDEHKSILGDCSTFETDLKKLELAVLELQEKYIQGCLNISWVCLPSRLSQEKYAWTAARRYRGEVDSLKSWLVLAIIRAKKAPLQKALQSQGAAENQRENQATELTNDAFVV
ncbi:hypothetical protein ARMGADRAFT_1029722 [Armillaria gallica]|uniref:F-box domain-containing protein n=1 Tax=Armillaria gallica TaxID=47427 RepID=A0A2H3DF40_ARMGA|nr:hypothetical protein ARMGADRAFT_1029722 [Armillaria gallica]